MYLDYRLSSPEQAVKVRSIQQGRLYLSFYLELDGTNRTMLLVNICQAALYSPTNGDQDTALWPHTYLERIGAERKEGSCRCVCPHQPGSCLSPLSPSPIPHFAQNRCYPNPKPDVPVCQHVTPKSISANQSLNLSTMTQPIPPDT